MIIITHIIITITLSNSIAVTSITIMLSYISMFTIITTTANPRTSIVDFRGFYSNINILKLIIRVEFSCP